MRLPGDADHQEARLPFKASVVPLDRRRPCRHAQDERQALQPLPCRNEAGCPTHARFGDPPKEIAERLGLANVAVVCNWMRKPQRKAKTVSKKRKVDETARAWDGFGGTEEERIRRLEPENDVLREVAESLKAESLDALTNREKTILMEHLGQKAPHPSRGLTGFLKISKSSYEYQRRALDRKDKYAETRRQTVEEFESAGRARGYRYITWKLRSSEAPIVLSGKVVRRLMAEEGCGVIYLKKARKYNSHAGELSQAPKDLVKRNFHAVLPNELWLTDITEFGLPCGRCCLSPVLDCFDGKLVPWATGTRPNADLANKSLPDACSTLAEGEHPVCYGDRGAHYRWPSWHLICEKNGVARSMSKKGRSPDDAAMEGFFGRLKNEFFHRRDWADVTMAEFVSKLDSYLGFYNEERPKETLGWFSPSQYREALRLAAWGTEKCPRPHIAKITIELKFGLLRNVIKLVFKGSIWKLLKQSYLC